MAPYGLRLYDDPHSLFCSKVKVVLHAKALAYEPLPVPCGSTKSPEYLRQNPLGKIPALVVTEAAESEREFILLESDAINEWLEEAFPSPPLLPPPTDLFRRYRARLLARFHDTYLEPALRKLYPHVAPAKRDAATVSAAVAEIKQRLMELEGLLDEAGPYAAGPNLTLADAGYPACFFYADLILPVLDSRGGIDYASVPRVRRLHAALEQHPAVQTVMQELGPAGRDWLQSKLQQ